MPNYEAEIEEFNPHDDRVHILIAWPGENIARYTGVIVECWDHKDYGRGKRAWLAEFDEAQRKKIGQLHSKAYGWCMRTGHPGHIRMNITTYDLLIRTANFFASI